MTDSQLGKLLLAVSLLARIIILCLVSAPFQTLIRQEAEALAEKITREAKSLDGK